MRTSFAGLALLAAAIALISTTAADAQLFRKRAAVQVNVNNGPAAVRVQAPQRQGLFARRAAVQVNVNQGQAFVRQPARLFVAPQRVVAVQQHAVVQRVVAVQQPYAANVQLIQRQQFRGQLDQLNTYSTVHNAPAVRLVTQNYTYVQPARVVAPVQVQNYAVVQPAPVVVQEYTQPIPQAVTGPACECETPSAAAPAAGNPDVQYSTQPAPQRVVQRVVAVQRPVAVTQQVYVRVAPVRVQQYVQHGCN